MRRAAWIILATTMLLGVVACGPKAPTAAEQKAECFSNITFITTEMNLFHADSGMYPPIATVVEKSHKVCPSGGVYSFDEATDIVSCSIHGHR